MSGGEEITTLGSTIAVITLIALLVIVPLIIYLRITLKFILDHDLQNELKGINTEAFSTKTKNAPSGLTAPPHIMLTFEKLTYTVRATQKQILKGVTGYFAPGTLTAILGTSGCGKTTLLTVLADQIESTADTTGDVYVNGKPRDHSFRRLCAYVMQSDNLLESLSVREALWFTAELRLGNLTQHEKMEIVKQTLRDLDLVQAADRRIAVLSGGQKRRVTVAVELVAMPSLVFLDEPTSGLDASGTLKLVKVLRNLANSGRTIVCTIHQPRIDAFRLFHMVYLMNAGSLLYFGPLVNIVPYFTDLGQKNFRNEGPTGNHMSVRNLLGNDGQDEEEINPADFVLDFTHGVSPDEIMRYCDQFAASPIFVRIAETIKTIHEGHIQSNQSFCPFPNDAKWMPELHIMPSPVVTKQSQVPVGEDDQPPTQCCRSVYEPYQTATKYASTNLKQMFTLTRRALVSSTRNKAYIMSWVLGIIMMLFMGMLYSSVHTARYAVNALATVNEELNNWGACTQNLTSLAVVLNKTEEDTNKVLVQCGTDITRSFQLQLARSSLLYQLLASMFFSEMPLVAAIHQERSLFIREHASRSYSSLAWTLSWICRIYFSGLVKGILYPPFVYFSAQLAIATEPYFLFCIFMGTMSVMGASVALLVTVAFPGFETASVAFVVVNIISQNLCGYFIGDNFIPWWFRWIYYMNFFRYTFQGTVLGQQLTPSNLQAAKREAQLAAYQQLQEKTWVFALAGIVFCFGVQLLAFLIVQFSGKPYVCKSQTAAVRDGGKAPEVGETRLGFVPQQLGGTFAMTTYIWKGAGDEPGPSHNETT